VYLLGVLAPRCREERTFAADTMGDDNAQRAVASGPGEWIEVAQSTSRLMAAVITMFNVDGPAGGS
jgi:hypothetical protein